MTYVIPANATHVVVIVIEFSDGGEPEEIGPLMFGTFDECNVFARTVPAASYSGARPVKGAHCGVYHLDETTLRGNP